MSDLIERNRYLIDGHRASDRDNDDGVACGCRADGLRDHSRHVAEQIVERLGLKPESVNEISNELRYVSAWFSDELTKLAAGDTRDPRCGVAGAGGGGGQHGGYPSVLRCDNGPELPRPLTTISLQPCSSMSLRSAWRTIEPSNSRRIRCCRDRSAAAVRRVFHEVDGLGVWHGRD